MNTTTIEFTHEEIQLLVIAAVEHTLNLRYDEAKVEVVEEYDPIMDKLYKAMKETVERSE